MGRYLWEVLMCDSCIFNSAVKVFLLVLWCLEVYTSLTMEKEERYPWKKSPAVPVPILNLIVVISS